MKVEGRSFLTWVKNAFFPRQTTIIMQMIKEKLRTSSRGKASLSVSPAPKASPKTGSVWRRLWGGRFARIAAVSSKGHPEQLHAPKNSLAGRVTTGKGDGKPWVSNIVSKLFSPDTRPIKVHAPSAFFSTPNDVEVFLQTVSQDKKNITRLISQDTTPIAFYVQTKAAAEVFQQMGFDYTKQIRDRGFFQGESALAGSEQNSTSGNNAALFLLQQIKGRKIEKNADTQALLQWYVQQGIDGNSESAFWGGSLQTLATELGMSLE